MATELQPGWEQTFDQAKSAGSQSDFPAAEKLLNQALEQAYDQSAPQSAVGEIFFSLAKCCHSQGKLSDALGRYRQALGTFERAFGASSAQSAAVLQSMGTMLCEMGKPEDAEPLLARALSIAKSTHGEGHPEVKALEHSIQRALQSVQSVQPPLKAPPVVPAPAVQFFPSAPPAPANNLPKRRLPKGLLPAEEEENNESTYEVMVSAASQLPHQAIDMDSLVHHREQIYGTISAIIGWFIYGLSFICIWGLLIAPLVMFGAFISGGLHMGAVRSRGVKVGEHQFPEVHRMITEFSRILNIKEPEVYVVCDDGILHAYATRFHRRDFVIISSNVLELAYEMGEKELAFVVAHELGHVKREHVKWGWLHAPAAIIPFFGNAYSRACEYTCDRIARALAPEGALFGLVALAAGTKLYRRVNLKALYQQQQREWDFWTWFHEIESTHPNLVNRITALGFSLQQLEEQMKMRGHQR